MPDPLDILQNPQPASQPDNRQLINTFNHADPNKRIAAAKYANGISPDFDEKIGRLHDVVFKLGNKALRLDIVDKKRAEHARQLFLNARTPAEKQAAFKMLDDENSYAIAHEAMGGPTTDEDWNSWRDYSGRKNVSQLGSQYPAPEMQQKLYDDGVDYFDRNFGHLKQHVVDRPDVPLIPQAQAPGTPMFAPVKNDIVNMMANIAPVQQQQMAGGPEVDPNTFSDLLR